MLYTANHEHGGTAAILAGAPICASTGRRGYTSHAKNHPCTKWVRESLAHYRWLLALAFDLVREHTFRFSPKSIHASHAHLLWLKANPPPALRMRIWLRDPPTAMPEEFRVGDSVRSYIAYYNGAKRASGLLVYTKRHMPHVFIKSSEPRPSPPSLALARPRQSAPSRTQKGVPGPSR